jgi:hypothetical protein
MTCSLRVWPSAAFVSAMNNNETQCITYTPLQKIQGSGCVCRDDLAQEKLRKLDWSDNHRHGVGFQECSTRNCAFFGSGCDRQRRAWCTREPCRGTCMTQCRCWRHQQNVKLVNENNCSLLTASTLHTADCMNDASVLCAGMDLRRFQRFPGASAALPGPDHRDHRSAPEAICIACILSWLRTR